MGNSYKIVGVIALAAVAACSTDTTSPDLRSPTLARADVTVASTNNVVVTESDIARQPDNTFPTRNWVFYIVTPTTLGAFVTGPGSPPLGSGSFSMGTPSNPDHGVLFNFDHVGTLLADINAISFATYRFAISTAGQGVLPAINIAVDPNGPSVAGGFTTLVYEPIYNTDPNSIVPGVWRSWDAYAGLWWSTRAIPGVCARDCLVTWSQIVASNPNATILGGFGVNQGSFSGGLFAATDALTIGHGGSTWIYNFEQFRSKKDCKKDGRNDASGDDGSSSKDKGDCKKEKKDKHDSSDED